MPMPSDGVSCEALHALMPSSDLAFMELYRKECSSVNAPWDGMQ